MKKRVGFILFAFLSGFLLTFVGTDEAQAIPAWARKYEVSCSMCHYPAVPRLNSYGQRFRRAGYRTEEEFGKDQEYKELGQYAAIRGRARYLYKDPEVGVEESEFQFHDATFFYSGAVTKNFSAFFELETEPEEEANATGVVAQIMTLVGKPDSFWTTRVGQFHTFSRVGFGGFDRPTGISTPAILANKLTSINPFKIGEDQRGAEAAYVWKDFRILGQVLNGVDDGGDGNEGSDYDLDKEKDLGVAFEWILDDRASGLTALVYRGRVEDDGVGANPFTPATGVTFDRYILTANKVFGNGFDVQGGAAIARDNPNAGSDLDGKGFFFALEKFFEETSHTIFGRYDLVDVNTDVSNNKERRVTLGWVLPVQEHIRFAAEYANIDRDGGLNTSGLDESDDQITGEIMVNF